MSPLKKSNNVAARMGRWSASHWKTAVFGWLAFVVVALAAGMAVGTKQIDTNDINVGQAHRAVGALRNARDGFDGAARGCDVGHVTLARDGARDRARTRRSRR